MEGCNQDQESRYMYRRWFIDSVQKRHEGWDGQFFLGGGGTHMSQPHVKGLYRPYRTFPCTQGIALRTNLSEHENRSTSM